MTYEGPEPDDAFLGIAERDAAMLMFKAIGVAPVHNHTRDIKQGRPRP